MKNFSQFITEAQESQASQRAKKMGLRGDGHGGWYNASGEFVAKTEGGELKFYNKGQKPGRDVPPKPGGAPQKPEPAQQEPPAEEQTGAKLTVVFGKFNPPTKAHQQLFTAARSIAGNSDMKIYPSRGQDSEMNPLKGSYYLINDRRRTSTAYGGHTSAPFVDFLNLQDRCF